MKGALLYATAIGFGGFIGAIARAGVGDLVTRHMEYTPIPYGTLIVNLLGCSAIGLLAGFAESRQLCSPEVRGFLLVGLLGGFTTFSAFAYETTVLLRQDEYLHAVTNVGLHIGLGVLLVWAGYLLAGGELPPPDRVDASDV